MPDAASSRADVTPARPGDLAALTALCLRSKAHWGYDDAFLAACRDEFSFHEADLRATRIGVIRSANVPVGVAQVSISGAEADLDKLFVDPTSFGVGFGRILFDWAVENASSQGATCMFIESDPFAQPFYERMGAVVIGTAPSAAIPGRQLPRLCYDITGAQ